MYATDHEGQVLVLDKQDDLRTYPTRFIALNTGVNRPAAEIEGEVVKLVRERSARSPPLLLAGACFPCHYQHAGRFSD